MKRFRFYLVLCGVVAHLSALGAGSNDSLPNPNIVLILADDLGYGDVSSYNPFPRGSIATPHIDQLARHGMTFTDAHSTSSVCTPSRYSILTGRYNWRTRLKAGVLGGYDTPLINTERSTLASILKRVGYTTACIGKWHLGMKLHISQAKKPNQQKNMFNLNKLSSHQQRLVLSQPIVEGPTQVGFDLFHGLSASLDMAPYLYIENNTFMDHDSMHMKSKVVEGRPGMASKNFSPMYVSDNLVKKAKDFLVTNLNAKREPLFLFLSLTSPHTPIVPSPQFQGKSSLGPYGDFVMQTDDVVGQIITTLKQLAALDNTLLIFTSDNGFSRGALSNPANAFRQPHEPSGIFRGGKGDIFEGGHRIPFVAHWPSRIQPNTINKTPISLVDLFATFLDITKQPVLSLKNHGEDSDFSLLPLFVEKTPHNGNNTVSDWKPKQFIVHSMKGYFAIREGKYLLALCSGSGGWSAPAEEVDGKLIQLYDLDADPQQLHDLSSHFGTPSLPSSSFRKKKSIFYVDDNLEPVYIRLLVGLLRIYNEWEWEGASYFSTLFNQRIVKGLLTEQLRRPRRDTADDSMEGLDERSVRFIQECILKGRFIPDKTVGFRTQLRTYFAKDMNLENDENVGR